MLRPKDLMYGDKLKMLRGEELQEWVAAKLEISQARLSDYENGKIPFHDTFIKDVCGFFKISVAEFKKPVLTPSLSAWLLELEQSGLFSRQPANIGKRLINLLLRRRIKVLEKENFELLWRLEQVQSATERIERRLNSEIYVIT